MPTVKKLRTNTPIRKHDNFYNGRPWRRTRSIKLNAEPRCEASLLLGKVSKATTVDHRLSRRFWPHLQYDQSNLISMSEAMHNRKRAIERTITTKEQYLRIFGEAGRGVLDVIAKS